MRRKFQEFEHLVDGDKRINERVDERGNLRHDDR
jgi:hypothetical protein